MNEAERDAWLEWSSRQGDIARLREAYVAGFAAGEKLVQRAYKVEKES